eukprot:TRINITY_DN1656_c0_g1_i2.p1 TRINITY_DN1656_c0_g1~~TRINITY_DN1656_c0_g1_i2.p1  ORF type:complete len:423 (-),score=89.56 TRINITY_DN1656_c0_g1_i2:425-1693(-)
MVRMYTWKIINYKNSEEIKKTCKYLVTEEGAKILLQISQLKIELQSASFNKDTERRLRSTLEEASTNAVMSALSKPLSSLKETTAILENQLKEEERRASQRNSGFDKEAEKRLGDALVEATKNAVVSTISKALGSLTEDIATILKENSIQEEEKRAHILTCLEETTTKATTNSLHSLKDAISEILLNNLDQEEEKTKQIVMGINRVEEKLNCEEEKGKNGGLDNVLNDLYALVNQLNSSYNKYSQLSEWISTRQELHKHFLDDEKRVFLTEKLKTIEASIPSDDILYNIIKDSDKKEAQQDMLLMSMVPFKNDAEVDASLMASTLFHPAESLCSLGPSWVKQDDWEDKEVNWEEQQAVGKLLRDYLTSGIGSVIQAGQERYADRSKFTEDLKILFKFYSMPTLMSYLTLHDELFGKSEPKGK